MQQAKFTKNGKTIQATALNDADMGFLSRLVCSGWYTEAEAFDMCYEYAERYVTLIEIA